MYICDPSSSLPSYSCLLILQSPILSLNEQHGQVKALSSSDPTRPTEEHIGQESVKDKPVILDTKVLSI